MRPWFSSALVAVAMLVCPPGAAGDVVLSSNWAGYAVHRPGVSFHKVFSLWRQPSASCTRGHSTYSAFWVGLGGYRPTSNALEQIGTEVDCKPSGRLVSSAWYELVPAPSRAIRLTVRPGDVVEASAAVSGHRVVVKLYDATSGRRFTRMLHAQSVDVSSAEWIVEAPSACISQTACDTLPLANFGSAQFGFAQAQSARGHTGAISDPAWHATRVRLLPGGRHFVLYHGIGQAVGAATPSALLLGGTSFDVNYLRVSPQGNPFFSRLRAAYLLHPGR